MGIWKMTQLKAPPLTEDAAELRKYLLYLSNQIASMLKDLDFTLNGDVDFRNVRAKSIKADRLNVDELSAITANMGKLTSGEIYGAYIATREAAYPRAEMSNTNDLFATYYDADNYIKYVADYTGAPAIEFYTAGTLRARFSTLLGGLQIDSPLGTNLDGTNRFQDWTKVRNSATGRTLQQDLDDIDSNIVALSSLYDSLNARVTALEGP
ncbi:hypothetical protein [Paenibacillus sp. FSL R7-0333]|uniref:hypothetical protein n=1 Tax=Paenibacillus sp. FSL R7-0333 TaxID=1926587 RepID=UPI00096BF38D|nr:hypothetical protein BK146_18015 [Paenibacillus sp. FSL R7-0333]